MLPSRLLLLGFLFAIVDRFAVHALSAAESELLKIPRAAAEKTYSQETMREDLSFDFTLEGMFAMFGGRMAIQTTMTEHRFQRKNANGGHDVYAQTGTYATMGGFPVASYKMDELVLDGVAWARLVEGKYDTELPEGWFQPADLGLSDLEGEVLDQLTQATGVEVKEAFLEENASGITEVAGANPDTRCFQVNPTDKFKSKMVGQEVDEGSESLVEKANLLETFCVEGGFLVDFKMDMNSAGFTTDQATDGAATGRGSNTYSNFGKPVYIPDPRPY
ncbi:hypothetical protein BSKO_06485 [Bryopsis sp. KO-2023]|nr:hypothetical protein BSKO_06485 [Bryopsis sp. KO-2023]